MLREQSAGGALGINLHRMKLPGGRVVCVLRQVLNYLSQYPAHEMHVACMWCLSIMWDAKE